jgi:hypothetical protein
LQEQTIDGAFQEADVVIRSGHPDEDVATQHERQCHERRTHGATIHHVDLHSDAEEIGEQQRDRAQKPIIAQVPHPACEQPPDLDISLKVQQPDQGVRTALTGHQIV